MELVTPAIGLIFWTTVVFTLLVLLLKKFAWKPILSAVDEIQNKKKDEKSKIIKNSLKKNDYSEVPKHTLKLIEEAEEIK